MTTKQMTEAETYESYSRTIIGSDGEPIGKVAEIYVDEWTRKPEWVTVSSGLFGRKSHFVPLAGAFSDGEDIRARVTMKQVMDAPSIDPDGRLSEREETELFEHYGIPYTNDGSTTAQGPSGDGQVADVARLRRYVGTEEEVAVVGSVRTSKRASAG